MATIDNKNVKLRIMTMNVKGLRGTKKRRALFRTFKSKNFDVICLQESHITKKDTHMIQTEWGSLFHLSEGSEDSKGILTLFNKRFKNHPTTSSVMNDRCLVSRISIDDTRFCFINVYAPCIRKEQPHFLDMVKGVVKSEANDLDQHIILLGDFNIVQDNKLDIISGNPHPQYIVNSFKEVTSELLLTDIWRASHGNRKEFTYSKNQKPKPFIARRLDYIFVSDSAVPFSKDSNIVNFGFSDHRCVTVVLDFSSFKRGPSCYKFNNSLLQNTEFVNTVISEINRIKSLDFDPHLCWEYIKAQVKVLGQSFGRTLASQKRRDKHILSNRINDYESYLAKFPNDAEVLESYARAKSRYEIIILNESEGARIRAGQKWAQEGEKNTKFFLSLEKQRSNAGTIFEIENEQDRNTLLKDPAQILDYIKDHFKSVYSSNNSVNNSDQLDSIFCEPDGTFLSEDDLITLNKNITETEILAALKSSNTNSAPGPDGLTSEFYKFFWKDIKQPLLQSFLYSFVQNKLSYSQNQGLICLHHKGKGLRRECIANWRPISLTNVDYKILTKVLARRLNTCLFKCIESDQYAFIKGRQVADLLRELDDIIEYGKSHFPENIILSLDYAKAFDTVSLRAIRKALRFFGFGEVFYKWIDIILTERKSCVRNGGYISDFFEMKCGVRQGCPISPLLFIITLELLARDIRNNKKIKGIKIGLEFPPIKIKMYADDATLFLNDITDFREVLSRIKLFSDFSGLSLNKNKSAAMVIGNPNQRNRIKQGIKFVNKIKILGITFSNETSAFENKENIEPKIAQLERICSLWEKRHLTLMGKITLLKSFGISQFIYIMQSISINQDYMNKINRILFKFIWNTKVNNPNRVTEKVKRTVLCSKYEEGGLNMIDIFKMQESFLLKWAERLLNCDIKHSSWMSIPLCVFKRVGGIMVFRSNVKSSDFKGFDLIRSTFWKNVLITWLNNKNASNEDIGVFSINESIFNNTYVRFKSRTIFIESCIRCSMFFIRDFIENDNIITLDRFKERFGINSETQLAHNIIYNALKPIEPLFGNASHNHQVDNSRFQCKFKNQDTGSITRKQFYNLINQKDIVSVKKEWRDKFNLKAEDPEIWLISFSCSSEVRVIQLQWKILHNIYGTGSLLFKMKKRETEDCDLCQERDTLSHFFVDCRYVRKVWNEAEKLINTIIGKHFVLDEKAILFGVFCDNSIVSGEFLRIVNKIILIGKLTISSFKSSKSGNIGVNFENELRLRGL